MLTPNEISEKKFDKVMVWGYDMNAVDSFLESVGANYTQLYKENIALKNKMKVLVSKIEEYRAVDDSMRQALLNAKNLASEMTTNAELDAAKQREAAEAEFTATLASYNEKIAAEEMRLEEAKTNVQVFIDKAIDIYKKETQALSALRERDFSYEAVPASDPRLLDTVPIPNIPPIPEVAAAAPIRPARTNVYEVNTDEDEEPPRRADIQHTAPKRIREEDSEETIVLTPKPRFEFNNLQFGDKYNTSDKKRK